MTKRRGGWFETKIFNSFCATSRNKHRIGDSELLVVVEAGIYQQRSTPQLLQLLQPHFFISATAGPVYTI